ncbi:MAG: hypothetical protein ACYDAL_17845 [Candidatus Dormibacteraceae bacterium]
MPLSNVDEAQAVGRDHRLEPGVHPQTFNYMGDVPIGFDGLLV